MLIPVRNLKKTAMVLVAAGLIAVPVTAHVYAQSNDDSESDTTTVTSTPATAADVATAVETEPATTETVAAETTTTDETTEPEVSTPETDTSVTLAEAQVIAETEHPDSTVVKSMTKEKDGQVLYAFYFADGWKVYVQASDGTVVEVKDKSGKDHDCQNKHQKTDTSEAAVDNDSSNWHRDWDKRGDSDRGFDHSSDRRQSMRHR